MTTMTKRAKRFNWLMMGLCWALFSSSVIATEYIYDELGRLISVIGDNGQSTVYRYDASNNLIAVEDLSQGGLEIVDFAPRTGTAGTVVSVIGSGFSGIPEDNTVLIGATFAQVLNASFNALTIVIPSGASTGLIQVDTAAGSASSAQALVIEVNDGSPVINTVSSQCVVAGQTFTVNGLNLEATQVSVGDVLTLATTDSAEQITVTAPAGSLGGRVTVSNSVGSVISEAAIVIVSAASECNSVDSARWIEANTTIVHPGVPSGKRAYWLFEADQDQWFNLQAAGPNADTRSLRVVPLQLYQPDGTRVYNGTLSSSQYTAKFNRTTQPGIYRLELGAGQAFDGVLETLIAITLDGPAVTVSTSRAQTKRLLIPQGTGNRFSISAQSLHMTGGSSASISMRDPANTLVQPLVSSDTFCSATAASPQCGGTYASIANGDTWILTWQPAASASISSAELLLSSPQQFSLPPSSQATAFNVQRHGQTIEYTFQAQAGDGYTLVLSGLDVSPGNEKRVVLHLLAPNGEDITPTGGNHPWINQVLEPGGNVTYQNLPETGTYTLRLVPFAGHLVSGNIRLDEGLPIDEMPLTISGNAADEHARLYFDAEAGDSYGLGFTNMNIQAPSSSQRSFTVKLYTPTGQLMPQLTSVSTSPNCRQTSIPGCDIDYPVLPQTGRYAVVIEPNKKVTSYQFDVQITPDVTATIENTPFSHTIAYPGQNAQFTFEGIPGQAKQLVLQPVLIDPSNEQLRAYVQLPDGTPLAYAPLLSGNPVNVAINNVVSIGDFPIAGQYTLHLDPRDASTASFGTHQAGGVLDPQQGMTLQSVVPGPWRRVEFFAQAGEHWSFALHNVQLGIPLDNSPRVRLVLYDPDNQRVLGADNNSPEAVCLQQSGNWDCDLDLLPLTQTGTYQAVAYLPVDRDSIIVSADAIAVQDQVITDTVHDFILNQGQNGQLLFEVNNNQNISGLVTRNTVADSGYRIDVRVFNPNGERVYGTHLSPTVNARAFTVSNTSVPGTYRLEIDVERGRPGAVNVSVE